MRLTDIKKRFQAVKELLETSPLGPGAQPVEIRAAVIDAIESKIAILGPFDSAQGRPGRIAFPYDQVVIRLVVPAKSDKVPFETVFANLEHRVRDRLQERRCSVPEIFHVSVSFAKKPPAHWAAGQLFSIAYHTRSRAHGASARVSWPLLKVTVLKGTAAKKVYSFREPIILIGRAVQATDTRGRVRNNHVAFDDRNPTVSRGHARFKYDNQPAGYRVLDDGSSRGTRVLRGEMTITVPQDPRGIRLQPDDVIYFGDAVVRVTIERSPASAARPARR